MNVVPQIFVFFKASDSSYDWIFGFRDLDVISNGTRGRRPIWKVGQQKLLFLWSWSLAHTKPQEKELDKMFPINIILKWQTCYQMIPYVYIFGLCTLYYYRVPNTLSGEAYFSSFIVKMAYLWKRIKTSSNVCLAGRQKTKKL